MRGQKSLYEQIVRDLQVEGLLGQGQFLNITMTGRGMVESRTTDIAKEFLKFISRPA